MEDKIRKEYLAKKKMALTKEFEAKKKEREDDVIKNDDKAKKEKEQALALKKKVTAGVTS